MRKLLILIVFSNIQAFDDVSQILQDYTAYFGSLLNADKSYFMD